MWAAAALLIAGVTGIAIWGVVQWQHEQEQQRRVEMAALFATVVLPTITIDIPKGAPLQAIAERAVDSGITVGAQNFVRAARALRANRQLQAGVYRIERQTTLRGVLERMARGQTAQERITFLEGSRYAQLRAQLLADNRLHSVLATLSERELRATLGITTAFASEHLEGLFLPDTYFFTTGDSDLSILLRAHRALKHTLETAWARRDVYYNGILSTPYEALILASIVEKETGKAAERPVIASVFLNRLRKGMRLQADPTTIYGLGEAFDGNLTRRHLKQDTPYNTYTRRGLPPTPIALVGRAAIEAVLEPAKTDFYYFVATGDGAHYFSKTLREHNNAVNRYQRKRRG